jgi:hypothetical protein
MTLRCLRRLMCAILNLLLFCASLISWAQSSPIDAIQGVGICDVLKDPARFDGQLIRFRGTLNLEFEGDTVDHESCGLAFLHTGMWWQFGGDPIFVPPADVRRMQALITPVVKDAAFDEFHAKALARRARKPDGEVCSSRRQCAYYNVTATFSGRFFAGRASAGRVQPGGYGHMGCCHLFVIEQVADVVAERTLVPDDAQRFSCTSTAWQDDYQDPPYTLDATAPDRISVRQNANRDFLAEQIRMRHEATLAESVKSSPLGEFSGLTGTFAWSSPDLLTTYSVMFPQDRQPRKQKNTQSTTPIIVSIAKERCEPAS